MFKCVKPHLFLNTTPFPSQTLPMFFLLVTPLPSLYLEQNVTYWCSSENSDCYQVVLLHCFCSKHVIIHSRVVHIWIELDWNCTQSFKNTSNGLELQAGIQVNREKQKCYVRSLRLNITGSQCYIFFFSRVTHSIIVCLFQQNLSICILTIAFWDDVQMTLGIAASWWAQKGCAHH